MAKRCEHQWAALFEPPKTSEQVADRFFNPQSPIHDNARRCELCGAVGLYTRANRGRTIRTVSVISLI